MVCPYGTERKPTTPDLIWVDGRDYLPEYLHLSASFSGDLVRLISANDLCSQLPPALQPILDTDFLFPPVLSEKIITNAIANIWFDNCKCKSNSNPEGVCAGLWTLTGVKGGYPSSHSARGWANDSPVFNRDPYKGCANPGRIVSGRDGRVMQEITCSDYLSDPSFSFTKDDPSCVVPSDEPPSPGNPPGNPPVPPPGIIPTPPPCTCKGDKGDTGYQGPPGLPGIKGDKGDKGDTGADWMPNQDTLDKIQETHAKALLIPSINLRLNSLIENFTLFDSLIRELNLNFNFQFGIGNTSNSKAVPGILTAIYEIVACQDLQGEPITISDVGSIDYQSDTPLHSALLVLTRLPERGKEQSGENSPNLYYAGWASFGSSSHNSPREPIHYAYSRFDAPCNSTRFSFCCTNGAKASVILYRKKTFSF